MYIFFNANKRRMLVPDAADIGMFVFSFSFKIQRWNRHTSAERVATPTDKARDPEESCLHTLTCLSL